MSEHAIRQHVPWPPHPEADYMLSRFECSCGWTGSTFRDVRGNPDIQDKRAEAESHAAPTREEQS